MIRKFLSLLTALALCLSLLPGSALAEGEAFTVTIGNTTLVPGECYNSSLVTPAEGETGYLEYEINETGGTLTVHGIVYILPYLGDMKVSGGTLIITGEARSQLNVMVNLELTNTSVTLSGSVNLSLDGNLICDPDGTLKTEEGYSGAVGVWSGGNYEERVVADSQLWAVGQIKGGFIPIDDDTIKTCYKTDEGRIFYTPAETTGDTAILTLDNAKHEGAILIEGVSKVTIVPKGSNQIGTIISSNSSVTVGDLTVDNTLDTIVAKEMYDDESETHETDYKVYGDATLPDDLTVGQDGSGNTVTLTVMPGATLTIPEGKTLEITDSNSFENNGTIINEGTISIEGKTDISTVLQSLGHPTGGGKVTVTKTDEEGNEVESTYTNSGTAVVEGPLNFSNQYSLPPNGAGYEWKATEEVDDEGNITYTSPYTLTLTNVDIRGKVTLPTGCKVTVVTEEDSSIQVLKFNDNLGVDVTFSGKGELAINNSDNGDEYGIQGGAPDEFLTVDSGATVTFKAVLVWEKVKRVWSPWMER